MLNKWPNPTMSMTLKHQWLVAKANEKKQHRKKVRLHGEAGDVNLEEIKEKIKEEHDPELVYNWTYMWD